MLHFDSPRQTQLIFVLGSQRSGTTALLHSLGQDETVRAEEEHVNNLFYHDYFLRPPEVIREPLRRIPRRVAFKPVAELNRQSLRSLLSNYAEFSPAVAWVYRDPVPVWSSWVAARERWNQPKEDLDCWLKRWVESNTSALRESQGDYAGRIAIVRYEELCEDQEEYARLCAFLNVRPINRLFYPLDRRSNPAPKAGDIDRIRKACGPALALLDEHRKHFGESVVRDKQHSFGSIWRPAVSWRKLVYREPISFEFVEDSTLSKPSPPSVVRWTGPKEKSCSLSRIQSLGKVDLDIQWTGRRTDAVCVDIGSSELPWPVIAESPLKEVPKGLFVSMAVEIRARASTRAIVMIGSAAKDRLQPRAFQEIVVDSTFRRHVFDIRILRTEAVCARLALPPDAEIEVRELALVPFSRRLFEDHAWNGAVCATTPSSVARGVWLNPIVITGEPQDIQLLSREQRVGAYSQNHLFFWARAKGIRPLQVGICNRHRWGADPFWHQPTPIMLSPEPRRFHFEFATRKGSTDVNAVFNLGDSSIPVEISGVRFMQRLGNNVLDFDRFLQGYA